MKGDYREIYDNLFYKGARDTIRLQFAGHVNEKLRLKTLLLN